MSVRVGISARPRTVDAVIGRTLSHTADRHYVESVRGAGGVPLVLPVLGPGDVADLLDAVDALVLTGGGDLCPSTYGADRWPETGDPDPARDAFEIALVREAVARDLPVLAICRGLQVVNVALGGTLVQHVPAVTGEDHRHDDRWDEGVHAVRVDPASHLAGVLDCTGLEVNSLHHQAVDRPAPGLRPVAWAHDGTVEALEPVDGGPLLAVQWHPELLQHRLEHRRLFRALVEEALSR